MMYTMVTRSVQDVFQRTQIRDQLQKGRYIKNRYIVRKYMYMYNEKGNSRKQNKNDLKYKILRR